jgi:hypothetical protein
MSNVGIELAANYSVVSPAPRALLANVNAPVGINLSQFQSGIPTLSRFDIKCLLVQLGELESNSNSTLVTVGNPQQGVFVGNVTAGQTQVTISNLDNTNIKIGSVANLTVGSNGSFGNNTLIVGKSVGGNIVAGNFVVGCTYTVTSVGDTDFGAVGGQNVIGNVFIANTAGTGTGTASASNNQIILASNNTVTGTVRFFVNPLKLGKYQASQTLLTNAGYLQANGAWTGKDGIDSNDVFLSATYIQDLIQKNYIEEKYIELIRSKAIRVGDTRDVVAGMLALAYQYQDFGNPNLAQNIINSDGTINVENYSVGHRANVWRNTGQTVDSQGRPGHIYFNAGRYAIATLGADVIGGDTPGEVIVPITQVLTPPVAPSVVIGTSINASVEGNLTVSGNIIASNNIITSGNIITTGNITASTGNLIINGNIIPGQNVVFNLGNTTNRFQDLWLSGSSINLGNANISTNQSNVVITNEAGGSIILAGNVAQRANLILGNVFSNVTYVTEGVRWVGNGQSFSSDPYSNVNVAAYLSAGSTVSGTGAWTLPGGTTGERPGTLVNGMIRYNTSINGGSVEVYVGGAWVTIASANYSVGFVIVAGGGGGGGRIGGGGGGGGVMIGGLSQPVTLSTTYTVIVGAGGPGGNGPAGSLAVDGTNGGDSSVFGFIAQGGGGGAGTDQRVGKAGGSGGGGGRAGSSPSAAGGSATQTSSGIAIGYGNAGGSSGGGADRSGGGGGAGAAGATGLASGNGGIGITNPIPGSTVGSFSGGAYYVGAGGGGSAFNGPVRGVGGIGGGGDGITTGGNSTVGGSGVSNTGGGGGGGGYTSEPGSAGGAGGSGVVIIYYASTTQRGSGGTVTSFVSGPTTFWLHTYTNTGTFSFTA